MDIIYKQESYNIQGGIFEVYKEMGAGFLESVYQECLEREFFRRKIPFEAHPLLQISYKGEMINQNFIPDFVCYDKIIVEIKAVCSLNEVHKAQLINYLKCTGFKLGMLVNFGEYPKAVIKRIVI